MATRVTDEFGARANPPDANYPDGSLKNASAPGANDGSPVDERVGNDWEGTKQYLLQKASITPNGQPDTGVNSQIGNAIEQIANSGDSLVAGGVIYPVDNGSISTSAPNNSPLNARYFKYNDVLYASPIPLSGIITSIGTPTNGVLAVTVGGVALSIISVEGVSGDLEYTVGAGGIFTSINEAINSVYRMVGSYRVYSDGVTPIFTIRLLSGFIMAEQVWYESCNLGFIKIVSDDPIVTIQRSALTRPVGQAVIRYMAFVFRRSCIGPEIDVLFNMDTSGTATGRGGIRIEDNSYCYIASGAGVTNAADRGLHLVTGRADASNTVWDGAGNRGIRVGNQSMINAESVSCQNCGESGIAVDSASSAILRNAVCDGATVNGVLVKRSENVDLAGLQANDCGSYGANIESSKVTLEGCELLRAGVDGLIATDGSIIAGKTSNISDSTGRNVFARNNTEVDLHGGTYTGAGTSNVVAQSFTEIDASSSDLTGALGGVGAFAELSSDINLNNSNTSNASSHGMHATDGSKITCRNATSNNCGGNGALINTSELRGLTLTATGNTLDGVRCESGSTVSIPTSTITSNTRDNVYASNASVVDVHSSTLTGAGQHNINAQSASTVDATNSNATGATSRGVNSDAAEVVLRNTDISGSGGPSDCLVQNGTIVKASGATGTFSIAVNTLTASGIVFQ